LQKNEKLFEMAKNLPFSGGFASVDKMTWHGAWFDAADAPDSNRRIMPPLDLHPCSVTLCRSGISAACGDRLPPPFV
jgi:hypothetical protein